MAGCIHAHVPEWSFNRTYLELKSRVPIFAIKCHPAFNRTYLELKWGDA